MHLIALSLFALSTPACQQDTPNSSEQESSEQEKSDTPTKETPEGTSPEKDPSKETPEPSDEDPKDSEEPDPDEDPEEPSSDSDSEEPEGSSSTGEDASTSTTGDETQEDPETSSTGSDEGDQSSDDSSDSSDSTDDSGEEKEPAPSDEIQLFLSVDWEGVELESGNLRDMERFRRDFPEVPITHYLNAAYYTKPRANPSLINRQVKRTLLDIDELGLHIHGWKMLFEAAGVHYRSSPVFFGEVFVDKVGDAGHNIDIGAYSTDELRKVIAFSIDTLEKNGFGRAKSFRSGGWMSRRSVLEALTAEGIVRDASDVATKHFIDDPWHNSPLFRWLSQQLWPNTHFSSQPYYMDTAHGPLLQIPDNGALADYVTGDEMLDVYKACLKYKKAHPDEHVTMSFGFHTESATRFLGRVRRGLKLIYAQAKRDNIKVIARTSAELKVTDK